MREREQIELIRIENENDIIKNPFEMKAIDLYEIGVSNQDDARAKLLRYYNMSNETYLIRAYSKKIIGIFGIREVTSTDALPWALTAEIVKEDTFDFLRASVRMASFYKRKYELLYNFTSCKNVTAQRWLEYLGFNIL